MGAYLREALGRRYRPIAFDFGHGSFTAPAGGALPVRASHRTPSGRALETYALTAPPTEGLAASLAPLTEIPAYLPFSSTRARVLADADPRLHSYGTLPPSAPHHMDVYPTLADAFDGVVFLPTGRGLSVWVDPQVDTRHER